MKQYSQRCSLLALAIGCGGSAVGCNADRHLTDSLDAASAPPRASAPGKSKGQKPVSTTDAGPEAGPGADPVNGFDASVVPEPVDGGPAGPTPGPGAPEEAGRPAPARGDAMAPVPTKPGPIDSGAVRPESSGYPVLGPPDVVDQDTPFPEDEPVPVVFTDVGPSAGIGPYMMATGPRAGVAAEDYDGDGFVDLFVPTGEGFPDQLYHNLGDGTFEDIAAEVGLASTTKHRTALWFDADGDEDLDLVIASDCRDLRPVDNGAPCAVFENLWLYEQGADGIFRDVTTDAGLDVAWGGWPNQHRAGMAAGDIDGDGDLDLVVPGWQMRPFLFRNDGGGHFTDITEAAGISLEPLFYQRAVLHDFDRDGLLDLYFTIDIYTPNALYHNRGDGTFVDIAPAAGVDDASTDMGLTLGDFDNDGDFDFYVTAITQDVYANKLYENESDGGTLRYSDVAPALGVAAAGWGWGATFFDADDDGWLDLAVTNGSAQGSRFAHDISRFWLNPGPGGGSFLDATFPAGFNDTDVASGLLASDFDRDGDLDLVQAVNGGGPLRLLRNDRKGDAAKNHYLCVRPRQPGTPNAWAIGATVVASAGDLHMMRAITAGISTDSQEPAEAFFGLGSATRVDTVTVTWPSGGVTTLPDVTADQVLNVMP